MNFDELNKNLHSKKNNVERRDKEKGKLKKYLIITVIMLTLLPIVIDRFFAHEGYMVWCRWMKIESPMKVGEWFGFLGSYLGVIGTIMIGIVAYWQTHIINKQSEGLSDLQKQMAEMQKEISDFQIHPIIHIKEILLQVENGSNNQLSALQEIDDFYFTIYGIRREREISQPSGTKYILVTISFEDKGIIPTVQCEIPGLKWTIAGKDYNIRISERKQRIYAYDKIYILIDSSDFTIDEGSFFKDLDLHEHYINNGKRGYGWSTIELRIRFTNQKGNWHLYKLICRIKSISGDLKVDSLYLESEEEGSDGTK